MRGSMTAARAGTDIHVLTYNIHKGYCSGNRRFVLDSMRQRIAETGADLPLLVAVVSSLNARPVAANCVIYPR